MHAQQSTQSFDEWNRGPQLLALLNAGEDLIASGVYSKGAQVKTGADQDRQGKGRA
ncbi:MAG: hypothetical protein ACI9QQ_002299, partial [Myxococcota bacterium]